MKYYDYIFGDDKENDLILDGCSFEGIGDYDFDTGEAVVWNNENYCYFDHDGIPDDIVTGGHRSAKIVSQKVKDTLEKDLKVSGLEFFEVPLKHTKSDKVIDGYYVMNVLGIRPESIDRERSEIHVTELKHRNIRLESISYYVFLGEKLKGVDVFRVGDSSLFFSERVKDAFDKAGVTGINYGATTTY